MSKQITVDLVFNANTQQAQQQMRALQGTMNQLQSSLTSQISMNGLTTELSKAQDAVNSLKINLNQAFNVNTGRLDMTKFNQNMKLSGQSIKQYRESLQLLGTDGIKAFNQLSQAVLSAEMPLKRTQNLLTNMMDVFGNSIKWSIAYGSIHKITQGFREAFQYAEDLNKSLTNIRVITGQSTDEMAKFADRANKAAKSLATTTTAYTDAALIYYRQGLGEKEVEERTKTTLKLANVVGQGAEEVSEWMTAIWNNFDNGSKSLEYYADVISKLGVTTASSAEEIATGLEKFSAIANTVGLSYEYATSALATVTAQTRQSADVVGTAFKTLFARLQDLKLGNTLEDGTDLGQYSEALSKVGINIKDSSGNLKDMDNILDEMGNKWKTLDKDQQVALAKSVAGLRQYSQMVALMDNYDVFKDNIETAKMAEGTLQEQQKVWAESWEAASKRVKAAAEGLYDSLIDDKFFIGLENSFADLIKSVDELLDAMGGFKTLLPMIAGLILKAFGPAAIGAVGSFIKNITGPSQAQIAEARLTRADVLSNQKIAADNSDSAMGKAISSINEEQTEFVTSLEENNRHLNNDEIERLKFIRQQVSEISNEVISYGELVDKAQQLADIEGKRYLNNKKEIKNIKDRLLNSNLKSDQKDAVNTAYDQIKEDSDKAKKIGNFSKNNFMSKDGKFLPQVATKSYRAITGDTNKTISTPEDLEKVKKTLENFDPSKRALDTLTKTFGIGSPKIKEFSKAIKECGVSAKNFGIKTREAANSNDILDKKTKKAKKAIADYVEETKSMQAIPLGQKITSLASSFAMITSSVSMLTSGVQGLGKAIKDGDFGGIIANISSLAMGVSLLIPAINALGTSVGLNNIQFSKQNLLTFQQIMLNKKLTKEEKEEAVAKLFNVEAEKAKQIIEKLGNISKGKAILLSASYKSSLILEKLAHLGLIPAKLADKVATDGLTTSTWLLLAPIGLLLVAIAALAIAIIGIVAGVKALTNAYNADAIAAEKAKKHAEDTAKAYQEVKQAYDDLKSSIEDYNKAQLAIDKLTEGTKEWKEAIIEANQKVLEMMENYPELAKYVQNVNGRLTISAEGQEAVLNEQNQKVIAAGLIKQDAALSAKKAANKSRTTDLVRGELDTVNDVGVAAEIATGVVGIIFGEAGIKAAGVAAIGDAIARNEAGAQRSEKVLKDLNNLEQGDFELIFGQESQEKFAEALEGKIDDINDELVKALYENKDSVKELVKSNKDLEEAERTINQQKVDNLLMNTEIFNSSHYGKGTQKFASDLYKDMEDQLEKVSASDFYRGGSWTGTGIQSFGDWASFGAVRHTSAGEKAFKNYLISQGMSEAEANKAFKDSDFKGNRVEYTVGDEEKEVSYEELATAAKDIAMAEKAVEIAERVNSYTNNITKLSAAYSTDKTKNAISSYLENNDINLLTPEQYQSLKAEGKEKLTSIIKESVDEDTLNALGKNAEELAKELLNAEYNETEAINKIRAQRWEEYQNTLKAGAEQLEINKSAIEGYAEQLARENNAAEEDMKSIADLAVQHYKLGKGINELRKVFQDNIELLHASTDDSLDYYEALGKVEEQLEKTFGVKVSADFVKKNLKDIEDMANGDVEALKRLKQAVVEDFVIHIGLDEKDEQAILDQIQSLQDQLKDKDLTTKINLDNSQAIEAINTALATGKATIDEIKAMFNNADLSMPEYNMANIPHTTTSKTVTEISGGGPWDGQTFTSTTATTTYTQVPYFGTNKPVYKTDSSGGVSLAGYLSGTNKEGTKKYTDKAVKKFLGEEDNKDYIVTDEDRLKYEKEKLGKNIKDAGTGPTISRIGNIRSLKDIVNYDGKSDTQKAADNKKKLSDLDKELDRYHEINEILSDTERQLDRISKAKDKVYGKSRLSIMDNEIAKQREIIANNKALLSEAEAYLIQDRNNLLRQFAVSLDSTGRITNYEELQQGYINRLKGAINNETRYKRIEDEYNAFKNAASQYEETLNKVEEQVEKVNDEMDKLYEFNLEKIQYTVEIKVDIAEDDKAYIDFLMQKIDDDAFAAADAIALLGRETNGVIQQIEAYEQGIADIEAAYARGDITQAQAVENLREYRDGLIEANSSLLELRQSVQDKLSEAFDAWNEKLDKSRDKIEHLSSVLEHYKNIIDIVGKDQFDISNELMKQLRVAQLANAKDALAAAKIQKETVDQTLAGYKAAREAATDEESRKEWDKQIELAEEKATEAAEAFNEAFETALELVKENYQSTIGEITEIFEKAVSGIYGTLDSLQEEWDRQQEIAERYLATYEQTYEINKLNHKIQQDIEKSNNIGNQKQLRGLQAEMLKMTKDNQRLSKYDLEYLQKRYDLLVAEQALRDAQNAKSVVRLQRDSEGNFGYVYTADQNTVDEAQQKYEDALYAMEKYGADSIKQLNSQLIQINKEFIEAIKEISEDETLTLDERERKIEELTIYYNEKTQFLIDEAQKMLQRGGEMTAQYNADMATDFQDTLLNKMYPDLTSYQGYYEQSSAAMQLATDELQEAIKTYQQDQSDVFDQAGYDINDYKNTVQREYREVQRESQKTAQETDNMAKDMKKAMDKATNYVQAFQSAYSGQMDTIRTNTQTTIEKVNALIEEYRTLAQEADVAAEAERRYQEAKGQSNYSSSSGGTGSVGTGGKTPKGNPKPKQDKQITYMKLDPSHTAEKDGTAVGRVAASVDSPGSTWTNSTTGYTFFRDLDSTLYVKSKSSDYWYKFSKLQGQGEAKTIKRGQQAFKKSNYAYDTGGYTGSWGPEGRLAMLHQKEIVLNAHDTENFLTAIGIVRDISDQIEKNAMVMQYQATIDRAPAAAASSRNTLQQEVTIHAEFPNATNHSEIEEAFRNLTNYASQYANRKS